MGRHSTHGERPISPAGVERTCVKGEGVLLCSVVMSTDMRNVAVLSGVTPVFYAVSNTLWTPSCAKRVGPDAVR
jgi:hypothetical protein